MKSTGIEVTESRTSAIGIVDCVVTVTTEWKCPTCRTRWQKRGVHSGHLKTCRNCKSRFFLRKHE